MKKKETRRRGVGKEKTRRRGRGEEKRRGTIIGGLGILCCLRGTGAFI